MGQAKARGTYQERKALAIAKKSAIREVIRKTSQNLQRLMVWNAATGTYGTAVNPLGKGNGL